MGGTLVTWGIIAGYMMSIFFIGLRASRRIQNTDDFLVAGRNIGWFFLFCTMGATVVGGGSSIGAIGRTYEWGVLMLVVSTGWYLHFLLSGLLVAPKFRDAELYTVAGYFGHRFGENPRFFAMILSLLFSVFIVAAQMAAFGSVLTSILPQFGGSRLVLALAIVVGGTVVVAYSTAGGLLAVIHTDVYQFIILLIGFAVTLAACIPDILGSWETARAAVPQTFFQIDGGKGWVFLITTFLAFFLGETFAPGYATRYCVGKDVRQTRIGIAGVGVFLALTFPVMLFFIALYARLHFPDIPPQQALPMVIRKMNNPVIGGLIIGALMMAVMSSADSALNSSTAIFVKDLFEHQLGWKDRGDGRMLRLARLCSGLLGGAAILVAVLWSDIIGLLLFTYHLWAPAVILPVCVGVLSSRRSPVLSRNIFITMLVASAFTLAYKGLAFLNSHLDTAPLGEGVARFVEQVDASVFGVGISCLTFGIMTVLTAARAKREAEETANSPYPDD
jgi:SSS family solute:Na+ symporter